MEQEGGPNIAMYNTGLQQRKKRTTQLSDSSSSPRSAGK
jgi:hypothetical protein